MFRLLKQPADQVFQLGNPLLLLGDRFSLLENFRIQLFVVVLQVHQQDFQLDQSGFGNGRAGHARLIKE